MRSFILAILPGSSEARRWNQDVWMTVSVNCSANTFTMAGLVSLAGVLKPPSTDLASTAPAPVGGPSQGIRDYLCDGKIPAGATRYEMRALALEAGLRIITANRADPARQ